MHLTFTPAERLIVMMLADLMEAVKAKSEIDPVLVKELVTSNNEWALTWEYSGIFDESVRSEADVDETADILDMWSGIERSVEDLEPVRDVLHFHPRNLQQQIRHQALFREHFVGVELYLRLTVFGIDAGNCRLLRHRVALEAHAQTIQIRLGRFHRGGGWHLRRTQDQRQDEEQGAPDRTRACGRH